MGDFFRGLKEKLSETIKDLSAGGVAADPYERKLTEHVERATSDLLIGPDWGANLELIDTINNDPQGASDKVYRALRRCLLKPNIQTQLLTLNLLEACVKNCVPFFHQQLIYSDLWQEIMRSGEPMRNWDAEVRDRALGLVEDFGRGLPMLAYKEAYESLLDRGVDFPVRTQAQEGGGSSGAAAGAPYYSPPPMPPAAVAAQQGISPEDRAAIAAAVADLEASAAAQQARDSALAPPGLPSAGHVPALMGPAVLMGAPIRPPGYTPPPGYHAPHPAAVQPAMVAGAEPLGGQQAAGGAATAAAAGGGAALPRTREEVEQVLRVSRNSAELLVEMLAPLKASGDRASLSEPFVADLVDQCYRYKSIIHEVIPRTSEEDLISAALLANDELSRVLQDFEAFAAGGAGAAAAAAAGGGAAAGAAAAAAARGSSSGGAGAAGASSSSGGGPFTLLGDEEEEEAAALQTRRGGAAAVGSAPPAAPPVAASTPSTAGAGSGRLGEEQLVSEMDQLLLSAQPGSANSAPRGSSAAAGGQQAS